MDFSGMWRGFVVDNIDPEVKGRVKVHVPGVYAEDFATKPEMLPWAEPAMSIFGGSGHWPSWPSLNKETGVCSVPHKHLDRNLASQVWVFFERGDWMHPIYFAICQSGEGWFSEHPNQYVIQTNNIYVKIDDEPSHKDSTNKTDYDNSKNETYGKGDGDKKKTVDTTIKIKVLNPGKCAVDVQIVGDVNMKIDGNFITHITKNKHELIEGSEFKTVMGSSYYTLKGDRTEIVEGKSHQHLKDLELMYDNYSLNVAQKYTLNAKAIEIAGQMSTLSTIDSLFIQNNGSFKQVTMGSQGENWYSAGPVFKSLTTDEIVMAKGELHRSAKIIMDAGRTGCYRHSKFGIIDDSSLNMSSRSVLNKEEVMAIKSQNVLGILSVASGGLSTSSTLGLRYETGNLVFLGPSLMPPIITIPPPIPGTVT